MRNYIYSEQCSVFYFSTTYNALKNIFKYNKEADFYLEKKGLKRKNWGLGINLGESEEEESNISYTSKLIS